MARQKKISIGAINLTIHPHTTESYVSLFKDAYRLRRKCQVYSDKYGVIRNMYPVQDTEWGNGFMGEICIFTHIDTDQPWFNEQTNEPATDEELESITILDYLKPNMKSHYYAFFPKKHIFFFESYANGGTLGSSSVVRFLECLFSDLSIKNEYGDVYITALPAQDELDHALKLPLISRIHLYVQRPNPDHFESFEAQATQNMEQINAIDFAQTFRPPKGESLKIDSELSNFIKLAAKNGHVDIDGKNNDGEPEGYSTKDGKPYQESEYYDPDQTTQENVFIQRCQSMLVSIGSWFNQ